MTYMPMTIHTKFYPLIAAALRSAWSRMNGLSQDMVKAVYSWAPDVAAGCDIPAKVVVSEYYATKLWQEADWASSYRDTIPSPDPHRLHDGISSMLYFCAIGDGARAVKHALCIASESGFRDLVFLKAILEMAEAYASAPDLPPVWHAMMKRHLSRT